MRCILFSLLLLTNTAAFAAEDRLLYNRGAELAAKGHFDEAESELRQAAAVRDKTIAAKALTLLGQIAVGRAKQILAEKPTETLPEDRQKILGHLAAAEKSLSESLNIKQNEEARKNLEAIRAWRGKTTAEWSAFDREQNRNAQLQQRIQTLADWEDRLSEKIAPMQAEADSPRKSQTCYETGKEQKLLADELTLLQTVPPQALSAEDAELQEKWKLLPEMAKTAGEAADLLTGQRGEEALSKQQAVRDYLRSLIKNQQNQQNQNQDQQQEQNSQQQDQKGQEQKDESKQNEPQKPEEQKQQQAEKNKENKKEDGEEKEKQKKDEMQKEETSEEKAERLLKLVRRKQQQIDKRREEIRAVLMQETPVDKDW